MKFTINKDALTTVFKAESFGEVKDAFKNVVVTESSNDKATFKAAVPRVNLLPDDARERDATEAAKKTSVGIVAAVAVAAIGWWGVGFLDLGNAEHELQVTEAEADSLAADLAVYSPVTTLAAQSAALTATVDAQTREVIAHQDIIQALINAGGSSVDLTRVTVTVDAAGGGCVQTDPFNPVPLVGCVSFSGTTDAGHAGAAALISALQGDARFADPFIPSTAESTSAEGQATVTGTVGLTMDAYANQPETPAAPEDAAGTQDPTQEGTGQ